MYTELNINVAVLIMHGTRPVSLLFSSHTKNWILQKVNLLQLLPFDWTNFL